VNHLEVQRARDAMSHASVDCEVDMLIRQLRVSTAGISNLQSSRDIGVHATARRSGQAFREQGRRETFGMKRCPQDHVQHTMVPSFVIARRLPPAPATTFW